MEITNFLFQIKPLNFIFNIFKLLLVWNQIEIVMKMIIKIIIDILTKGRNRTRPEEVKKRDRQGKIEETIGSRTTLWKKNNKVKMITEKEDSTTREDLQNKPFKIRKMNMKKVKTITEIKKILNAMITREIKEGKIELINIRSPLRHKKIERGTIITSKMITVLR